MPKYCELRAPLEEHKGNIHPSTQKTDKKWGSNSGGELNLGSRVLNLGSREGPRCQNNASCELPLKNIRVTFILLPKNAIKSGGNIQGRFGSRI